MKANKASGPDNIPIDILKYTNDLHIQDTLFLFNNILQNGQIPDRWKSSNVILIYKKGDKRDLKNYRPISLTQHTAKLFFKIISNRIEGKIKVQQTDEQAGFRATLWYDDIHPCDQRHHTKSN